MKLSFEQGFDLLFQHVVLMRYCIAWVTREVVEDCFQFKLVLHGFPRDGKHIHRKRVKIMDVLDLEWASSKVGFLREFIQGPMRELDEEFREIERTLLIYQGKQNYWEL